MILLFLLSSAGCAFKPSVTVITRGTPQPFWQSIKKGAEKAARDFDVELTFTGPATDRMAGEQTAMVKEAIDRDTDALVLAALDSKAVAPLLAKAETIGIPVIGIDSGVDGGFALTNVATDNLTAGALAADMMAEHLPSGGKVAIIAHDPYSRTGVDRRDGFLLRIRGKHPGIDVVEILYGDGRRETSAEAAARMIHSHPDLKGIFGTDEISAEGIVEAVRAQTMAGRPVVVGFDSGSRQMAAIRAGIQAGAVTQDPVTMGYKAVEAAARALHCESLPERVSTRFHWYDKTNIDTDLIRHLLYP